MNFYLFYLQSVPDDRWKYRHGPRCVTCVILFLQQREQRGGVTRSPVVVYNEEGWALSLRTAADLRRTPGITWRLREQGRWEGCWTA